MSTLSKKDSYFCTCQDDMNIIKHRKDTIKCIGALLLQQSHEFSKRQTFPLEHNRCQSLIKRKRLTLLNICESLHNSYTIISKGTRDLIIEFIQWKQHYGSSIEQELYHTMTWQEFIKRLYTKRPFTFYKSNDSYLLRNGKNGKGKFETIGTMKEKYPLILKDYLSYDEMKISALLNYSTPSLFINNGNRNNVGIEENFNEFETQGIIIGQVGCRLKKPFYMEWQDMIITSEQNTLENGYGKNLNLIHPKAQYLSIWKNFYEKESNETLLYPTFDEVKQMIKEKTHENFLLINENCYLNINIFQARIQYSGRLLLFEANQRAKTQNKKAYVHIVGLGLGVWKINTKQNEYFLNAYGKLIEKECVHWSCISHINFSWIDGTNIGIYKNGDYTENGIQLHLSERNPQDLLSCKESLLIVSYAWDGNSYPGNEYWLNKLGSSGDSAAASCSQISEYHNPEINPLMDGEHVLII